MLSAAELAIVALSLQIALLATVVCLPFAIATAWLLARKKFYGKTPTQYRGSFTLGAASRGHGLCLTDLVWQARPHWRHA